MSLNLFYTPWPGLQKMGPVGPGGFGQNIFGHWIKFKHETRCTEYTQWASYLQVLGNIFSDVSWKIAACQLPVHQIGMHAWDALRPPGQAGITPDVGKYQMHWGHTIHSEWIGPGFLASRGGGRKSRKRRNKNPAYGRQQLSRPIRIVGPLKFFFVLFIFCSSICCVTKYVFFFSFFFLRPPPPPPPPPPSPPSRDF